MLLKTEALGPRAQVLQSYLGKSISGLVAHTTDKFAIMLFDVPVESGGMEKVRGMLHSDRATLEGIVVSKHLLSVRKLHRVGSQRL